jgi:Sulfotransferase domain
VSGVQPLHLTLLVFLTSVLPMVLWLASYPRSGNKLTRLALNVLFGVPFYTLYQEKDAGSKWSLLSQDWDGSKGLPASAPPLASGEFAVVKTHELPVPRDRLPALYILRDGRDAYVSYAHFSMRKHPDTYGNMSYAEVLEKLIRSTRHFGGWSAHVEAWTTRSTPTAVIRFEDLLVDPADAVTKACTSLGLEVVRRTAELPAFGELQAQNPAALRKGKAGTWREEMPPHLESLFWSIHGPCMERLGYPR